MGRESESQGTIARLLGVRSIARRSAARLDNFKSWKLIVNVHSWHPDTCSDVPRAGPSRQRASSGLEFFNSPFETIHGVNTDNAPLPSANHPQSLSHLLQTPEYSDLTGPGIPRKANHSSLHNLGGLGKEERWMAKLGHNQWQQTLCKNSISRMGPEKYTAFERTKTCG